MPKAGRAAGGTAAGREKRRKEKLEREALKNELQAEEWMAKYDKSKTSRLNQDETRALLTDVKREMLKDPAAEVDPKILDRVMKKFDYSGDGQIERTELATAVKKYKAFLKHQDLFERHDKDKTGVLTPDQIKTLLTEVAMDMPEWRPYVEWRATDADVEFVMERCDKDHSGSISMEEVRLDSLRYSHPSRRVPPLTCRCVPSQLGPAISTWKEAAHKIGPEPAEKSSACALL